MYYNPHLRRNLLPTIAQVKRYIELATTEVKDRDIRPLMSFLQRLPQADPYLFGLIQTRKLAITGYDYKIQFPSDYKASATEISQLVQITKRFKQGNLYKLFPLILNGFMFGISAAKLTKENTDIGTTITNFSTYDLTEIDTLSENEFVLLSDNNGMLTKAPLSPEVNLLVNYNPLYGIAQDYCGSIVRVNMIYVLLKYLSKFWWSKGNEKFGNPTIYAQYKEGADRAEVSDMIGQLDQLANTGTAAFDERVKIALLEAQNSAQNTTFKDFIDAVNTEMAISFLGQNLTTEVKGGSRAAAEVQDFVRKDILYADLIELQNIVSKQIIKADYINNYGEPKNAYPELKFVIDEKEDYEANARVIAEVKSIAGLTVPLLQSELYNKIGFTEPTETDITI